MTERETYPFIPADSQTTMPQPHNDNWGVKYEWQTPAEALQKILRLKAELRRELAEDFRLRDCPTHRRHWEAVQAMEKICRWHHLGERD